MSPFISLESNFHIYEGVYWKQEQSNKIETICPRNLNDGVTEAAEQEWSYQGKSQEKVVSVNICKFETGGIGLKESFS